MPVAVSVKPSAHELAAIAKYPAAGHLDGLPHVVVNSLCIIRLKLLDIGRGMRIAFGHAALPRNLIQGKCPRHNGLRGQRFDVPSRLHLRRDYTQQILFEGHADNLPRCVHIHPNGRLFTVLCADGLRNPRYSFLAAQHRTGS